MFLEILSEEEKRAFNLPNDSKEEVIEEIDVVIPKEESDDGLTFEEQKELDKRNDFLVDCGCFISMKKGSPDASLKLNKSTLSIPSKPQEMFLPFQSIVDRRFIEAFPNGLLGEIYGRARTCLPYRACRFCSHPTKLGFISFESTNPLKILLSTIKFVICVMRLFLLASLIGTFITFLSKPKLG